MAPEAVKQNPVGFENATRHNIRQQPAITYSAGALTMQELPKVGLISKIWLKCRWDFTDAAGSTLADSTFLAYKMLRKIKLSLNNGTDIVNVTGFGLYLCNIAAGFNNPLAATSDTTLYTLTNLNGANTVDFWLEVPIATNDRDNLGFILLQNPTTQAQLSIEFDDIDSDTGCYTNGAAHTLTAITGSVTPFIEYFSVPADPANMPPIDVIHQTLESSQVISAVGEQTFDLPQGNIYTRLLIWHKLNNILPANSTVTKIELTYNESETPYTLDANLMRAINQQQYGRDLPTGCYVLDFNHQGLPNLGTARDYINSRYITEFKLKTTVAADATIGTASLNVVRQQLLRAS